MMSRKTLLASLISLIAVGCLTAFHALADTKEAITTAWKSPVNDPICLALSAGGKYSGSVDKKGGVRLYDESGHIVWEEQVEGATDVLVARNGQSVLVYSKLNPVFQDVYFFRRDGTRLWKHRVEGCVWSGAVSADGLHAAVTTGEKYIYLYAPDPKRPRYNRWRLEGIGYRAIFTPDNQRIVVGTWQDSALACYDLKGRFQWRCRNDETRQYDLHISADSRGIVGVIPATIHDPRAELAYWDSGGKLIWEQPIKGFEAHALISPKSQYVAVSFTSFLSEKGDGIVERRVAVYRSNGTLLWEKGGLFFEPKLVALSPTGDAVIVSDGERSLYNIDRRGRILSKLILPGTIRKAMSSDDGRRILLYCGDGYLYLMHVG